MTSTPAAGGASKRPSGAVAMTPMFQQYHRFKEAHKDAILFFRMGDFYEMFYEDARIASRVLGLTLTSRSKEPGAPPMAGVPHHAADGYAAKLLRAGYKVAVCDQIEDPAQAKGLVERAVTRILTPGTLTEEDMLASDKENFLAAAVTRPDGKTAALAWVELSTGAFEVAQVTLAEARTELARLAPAECLFREVDRDDDLLAGFVASELDAMITRAPGWTFEMRNARGALLEHFGVGTLAGFGLDDKSPALAPAGAVLRYLGDTQKTALPHIRAVRLHRPADYLVMDPFTIRALELTETMRTGEQGASLFSILDRTRTPMGKRLLRRWVLSPLVDTGAIRRRHDAIDELAAKRGVLDDLSRLLEDVYDVERLAGRIATRRAGPRDLLGLAASLGVLPDLAETLAGLSAPALAHKLDALADVRAHIERAIAPDAPIQIKEGRIIAPSFNARLDELRALMTEGTDWIARYQAQEIERTGIPTLKVGFNNVFGYYIEVTHLHREKVPDEYHRKQTLKNAERYITPELKEYERKVLSAQEESRRLEYELFTAFRDGLAEHVARMQETAGRLAAIDALCSLAAVAIDYRYVRPEMCEEPVLLIREGRHPVLERTLVETRFVPNDTSMTESDSRIMLITGPNMAGKSTYIRQVALIALMAHTGSFVPAAEAVVGRIDRIFTRVGATDELARGQSTFMVEMTEAANILNNATSRSLIVLDEVGRGTSTFDGISLAWAITEYLNEHVDARTLFATHYHELTELADHLDGVGNYNVAVKEWQDEVVFLRRIVPGGTDKSYGIHVARLAGVPGGIVDRAKAILANLEQNALSISEPPREGNGNTGPSVKVTQLSLFRSPAESRILEQLRQIDPETLSPLEALDRLARLKREMES